MNDFGGGWTQCAAHHACDETKHSGTICSVSTGDEFSEQKLTKKRKTKQKSNLSICQDGKARKIASIPSNAAAFLGFRNWVRRPCDTALKWSDCGKHEKKEREKKKTRMRYQKQHGKKIHTTKTYSQAALSTDRECHMREFSSSANTFFETLFDSTMTPGIRMGRDNQIFDAACEPTGLQKTRESAITNTVTSEQKKI